MVLVGCIVRVEMRHMGEVEGGKLGNRAEAGEGGSWGGRFRAEGGSGRKGGRMGKLGNMCFPEVSVGGVG